MGRAPQGLPRLLAGLASHTTLALAAHTELHGRVPDIEPRALIAEVAASGLRGRGGADFPTARKLEAVAARRRPSAVVVNGTETEPASRKDVLLLARVPHLVLDGAILAARAVGAPEVVVRVREDATAALEAVERAVADRSGDGVRLRVAPAPGGYVSGEESATVHHLNGGRPLPVFVPPRPFERGYRNRPTLIQNTETLAQLALIARHGAEWFRALGTEADPGSVLVTVSGAVRAPGVYEMAFGTSMDALLEAAGGPAEPLRALLVGGYFGTWVEADRGHSLRLARSELVGAGCSLGSGVIFALGASACGLHESAAVIDYLARESAGQCGPCVHGLRAVADAVAALASGSPSVSADRLHRWLGDIDGRGACHHPDGAVRFVRSTLAVFGPEIRKHTRGSRCRARPAGLPLGPRGASTAGLGRRPR
jgi:NADH:ubiquinone oxidoreductase subunit F (NADH-binding)